MTILGERMATDLRVQLFRQLLLLDMQFFDSQKTGELTSRLNGDVQEFKSSFKLTVAQGLKTIAQVLFITLSLVLLQFVDNRLCGVPDLYLAQTHPPHGFNRPRCRLLRSHFRCTASDAQQTVRSKKNEKECKFLYIFSAQAQSAIAASVAEEAFGNIQVVKAYATEELETK